MVSNDFFTNGTSIPDTGVICLECVTARVARSEKISEINGTTDSVALRVPHISRLFASLRPSLFFYREIWR